METNFTKGEWVIENKNHNLYSMIYSKSGKRIAEIKSYGEDDYPSVKERTANAKLISAAPDLLNALKELVSYIEIDGFEVPEIAINAIKKATE